MRRTLGIAALLTLSSAPADAVSLSVVANKATYSPGETVTLTVFGDDAGASSYGIFGRLVYNGIMADNGTRSQATIQGNLGPWIRGVLDQGDTNINALNTAFSVAFNQIAGLYAQTATNLPNVFSTVTLIARAYGVVNVAWDSTTPGWQLDFFGLTNAPGTSFTVVESANEGPTCPPFCSSPEPATGTLVVLGLLSLALLVRASRSSSGALWGRPGRARES